MQTSNRILNNSTDRNNALKVLICPYCKKDIPRLTLLKSDQQMDINVNCSCLKEDKKIKLKEFMNQFGEIQITTQQCAIHTLKGEKYCCECSSWLCQECINKYHSKFAKTHVLLDQEIKVKCIQHGKAFSSYCRQCSVNICLDCASNHKNHQFSLIRKVELRSINMECWDKIMNRNKQHTDQLIQSIDTEISKLTKIKLDIISLLTANQTTNQELKMLYQCFSNMVFTLRDYPLSS